MPYNAKLERLSELCKALASDETAQAIFENDPKGVLKDYGLDEDVPEDGSKGHIELALAGLLEGEGSPADSGTEGGPADGLGTCGNHGCRTLRMTFTATSENFMAAATTMPPIIDNEILDALAAIGRIATRVNESSTAQLINRAVANLMADLPTMCPITMRRVEDKYHPELVFQLARLWRVAPESAMSVAIRDAVAKLALPVNSK